MPRHTTVYLRGALVAPKTAEEATSADLGFDGDKATCLDLGSDAHVYVDQGGALIVETVPIKGPAGGYGHRRTFPSWRIIEVAEVDIR